MGHNGSGGGIMGHNGSGGAMHEPEKMLGSAVSSRSTFIWPKIQLLFTSKLTQQKKNLCNTRHSMQQKIIYF